MKLKERGLFRIPQFNEVDHWNGHDTEYLRNEIIILDERATEDLQDFMPRVVTIMAFKTDIETQFCVALRLLQESKFNIIYFFHFQAVDIVTAVYHLMC